MYIESGNSETDYKLFECLNGAFGNFVKLECVPEKGHPDDITKLTTIEYEYKTFVFENFNYGYQGTGANYLAQVLMDLGCHPEAAEMYVYSSSERMGGVFFEGEVIDFVRNCVN